ncbi:MAG: hypothetical protein SWE60_26580 [Thermodesulfobacteriota bacterium]|nr:hypothetical protein [Thermodesulfobacteriota bacterium]
MGEDRPFPDIAEAPWEKAKKRFSGHASGLWWDGVTPCLLQGACYVHFRDCGTVAHGTDPRHGQQSLLGISYLEVACVPFGEMAKAVRLRCAVVSIPLTAC